MAPSWTLCHWDQWSATPPNDLRAGRAADVHTVAALYGYGSEAELRSIGADDYWVRFGTA